MVDRCADGFKLIKVYRMHGKSKQSFLKVLVILGQVGFKMPEQDGLDLFQFSILFLLPLHYVLLNGVTSYLILIFEFSASYKAIDIIFPPTWYIAALFQIYRCIQ